MRPVPKRNVRDSRQGGFKTRPLPLRWGCLSHPQSNGFTASPFSSRRPFIFTPRGVEGSSALEGRLGHLKVRRRLRLRAKDVSYDDINFPPGSPQPGLLEYDRAHRYKKMNTSAMCQIGRLGCLSRSRFDLFQEVSASPFPASLFRGRVDLTPFYPFRGTTIDDDDDDNDDDLKREDYEVSRVHCQFQTMVLEMI